VAYSLWMPPMSVSAACWHLWITAASVVAFVIFFTVGNRLIGTDSVGIWVALISEVFSGLAFAAGCAVFLANLTHAVYQLAQNGFGIRAA
jgi:hypothetical protein